MFAAALAENSIEEIDLEWDFFADKVFQKFSTFRAVSQHIYGIRRRNISMEGVDDPRKGDISAHLEIGPNGLVEIRHEPMCLMVTTAGTPHHVSHNFGYWHINDKDEVYLNLPGEGEGNTGYSLVFAGFPREDETDRFAWYCSECLTMLHEYVYETGKHGLEGFWHAEEEAVSRYNSDEAHRICPECNHLNPRGYRWAAATDSPEEAEARKLW